MLRMLSTLPPEQQAELLQRLKDEGVGAGDFESDSGRSAGAAAAAGVGSAASGRRLRLDEGLRGGPFPRQDDAAGAYFGMRTDPRYSNQETTRRADEERKALIDDPLAFDQDACMARLADARFEAERVGADTGSRSVPADKAAQELAQQAREDALQCDRERREFERLHADPFGQFLDRPRPFGYELFEQAAEAFSPTIDIPVPSNYVLGPGDRLEVQLFGKENRRLSLTVTRDGVLQFPQLGPIGVAGMSFDEVRDMLEAQVAESMIGVQASVTLGSLRSIQVFVLGDVRYPGSYTVGSLSTMTHALAAGGGIRETGSLRRVQLKRAGRVVTTLDLYDLLLRGDTSGDERLQPGDVVFIPPVGKTVSVSGEVVRPAMYELGGRANVQELIELGGGLLPTAYVQKATLERIRGQADRTIETLDLSGQAGLRAALQAGDHLRVYSVFDRAENVVLLSGAVERPGLVQWRSGMRLTDVISDLGQLRPGADRDYVLVRREVGPERRVETLSASLAAALADPVSPSNIELASRDQLVVFPREGSREALLAPIVREMHRQAGIQAEAQVVEISGRVKAPGLYPLTTGMTALELLRAAGGGMDDAYPREVEVTRRAVVDGQRREITRLVVNLADVHEAHTRLQPYDTVNVRPIEGWNETEKVVLRGEVKLPGEYVIQPNETMDSLIRRAGGFTDQAYLEGTVFSRAEIRERQQEELARQGQRLRAELMQVQLDYRGPTQRDVDVERVRQLGALLAEELNNAQALGRVVVDMPAAVSGARPLSLRDGDEITVPRRPSEVTVLGEVSYPTTHLYQDGNNYRDYLRLSGGFSQRADQDAAFVVRINGEVQQLHRADDVRPGDVVVVPFKVDRGRGLFITSTIAQIIGQLAITAASFKTVGVF